MATEKDIQSQEGKEERSDFSQNSFPQKIEPSRLDSETVLPKPSVEKEGRKEIESTEGVGKDTEKPSTATTGKTNEAKAENLVRKSSIRTYQSDIAEVVKSKKTSLASIALAEIKRDKKAIPKRPKQLTKKDLILIISGVVLIILGLLTFALTYRSGPNEPPEETVRRNELIFVNAEREVPVDALERRDALRLLESEVDAVELPLGSVADLYLTTEDTFGTRRLLTATELFSLLEVQASAQFIRSLENEFMFGVHAFDNNQAFLILKTGSFDNAFAGMLDWEATIAEDLPFLIRKREMLESSTTTNIASVTDTFGFQDRIIRNRDVRALLDEEGESLLMYSFPDQKTLVITTNRNTLVEIFGRLSSVRLRQ